METRREPRFLPGASRRIFLAVVFGFFAMCVIAGTEGALRLVAVVLVGLLLLAPEIRELRRSPE